MPQKPQLDFEAQEQVLQEAERRGALLRTVPVCTWHLRAPTVLCSWDKNLMPLVNKHFLVLKGLIYRAKDRFYSVNQYSLICEIEFSAGTQCVDLVLRDTE